MGTLDAEKSIAIPMMLNGTYPDDNVPEPGTAPIMRDVDRSLMPKSPIGGNLIVEWKIESEER